MKNRFKIILEAAKKARMLEQNKIKFLFTKKKPYPVALIALEQVLKKEELEIAKKHKN